MSSPLEFYPGLPLQLADSILAFEYGPGVFGPEPEMRRLDAIRPSLRDPQCSGPDPVYGIAMDIGRPADRSTLQQRMLLFGAVIYASGALGAEPVRSQGHVHAIAPHCGWSTPEVFEIWSGKAIIFAQESVEDDPGHCIAVVAEAGEQVVVPPGWAHCVINADPAKQMSFGACCDREYGFDYTGVRAHHGLAWFPMLTDSGDIEWEPNRFYSRSTLEHRKPRSYPELGLDASRSIYKQFMDNPESMMFVSDPQRAAAIWPTFIP
ncbi:MAG: glucose-6-phosphate isomerase family protein [Acidobacteriaceae bacterium]|nr:glucose-6-phosphate isomerase family protein [Acidobacteriaceae bacterium]